MCSSLASAKEPWNGEYYCSYRHGLSRDWNEARRYGFISAGGGSWYSGTLRLLHSGDLVWVKAPGFGFVGVGRFRSEPVEAVEFNLVSDAGQERLALEILSAATYHKEYVGDPERAEYFVSMEWAETRDLNQAVNETGMFGNQNTICAHKTPKWRHTVERLKELFPRWNTVA